MQIGMYSFLLDRTVWKTSSKMCANPSEFFRIWCSLLQFIASFTHWDSLSLFWSDWLEGCHSEIIVFKELTFWLIFIYYSFSLHFITFCPCLNNFLSSTPLVFSLFIYNTLGYIISLLLQPAWIFNVSTRSYKSSSDCTPEVLLSYSLEISSLAYFYM